MPVDNPVNAVTLLGWSANVGTWVITWLMGRIWLETWRKDTKRRLWLLYAPAIIAQLALALFYENDLALVAAYELDHGATLPYGPAWFWLNPFYGLRFGFLEYLFVWSMGVLAIMWVAARRGLIDQEWVFKCQLVNMLLVGIHNPQSIVPISFVYLVPILGPGAFIVAALIKLPIGWSPLFANRHWDCAFGTTPPPGAPYWECLHFTPAYFLNTIDAVYNFSVYLLLGLWCAKAFKLWTNTRQPVSIRALGFRFLARLRLLDFLRDTLQANGLYERRVAHYMTRIRGDLFVDVGSNNGYYARLLKNNFKQCVTVDPSPSCRANYQVALSDRNGDAIFYTRRGGSSADSLLPSFDYKGGTYRGKETRKVQTCRFDALFPRARLVKIDVEGAELAVLRGMSGSIVERLVIEVHRDTELPVIVQLLHSRNYQIWRIDRVHLGAALRAPSL